MTENIWNCFQSLPTLTFPTNTHPRSQIGVVILGGSVYRDPGSLHITQSCPRTVVPKSGVFISM